MSLGIGVMLNMMSSNQETLNALSHSIGKEIMSIQIENEELKILLSDEKVLLIWDDGQSCCEYRYMRTDDELDSFIGEKIVDFELKDADIICGKYCDHEIQFLEIKTDKSVITFSNHNEHNGYYGGFSIKAKLI